MERYAPKLDDVEEHHANERLRPLHPVLERVGLSDEHVIVTGTPSSDREWIGRFVHRASPRHDGPFVAYAPSPNWTATSATARRSSAVGRAWFSATGGTLFISELCDLMDQEQARLLRFLERSSHSGTIASRRAPVRVVA